MEPNRFSHTSGPLFAPEIDHVGRNDEAIRRIKEAVELPCAIHLFRWRNGAA
jgi:hypothetical protein